MKNTTVPAQIRPFSLKLKDRFSIAHWKAIRKVHMLPMQANVTYNQETTSIKSRKLGFDYSAWLEITRDLYRVNELPAVAKVALVGTKGASELATETAAYHALKDSQGQFIPHLLLSGALSSGRLFAVAASKIQNVFSIVRHRLLMADAVNKLQLTHDRGNLHGDFAEQIFLWMRTITSESSTSTRPESALISHRRTSR